MIYEILKLALFSVWITGWFTPLNWLREVITEWWTKTTIKMGFPAFQRLAIVLSCSKCFGFWFTLIYTNDFWLALNVSAVAFGIKFIIDKIEYWYEK